LPEKDGGGVFLSALVGLSSNSNFYVKIKKCVDNVSDIKDEPIIRDLTPFAKFDDAWCTVLKDDKLKDLFGKCVTIFPRHKRDPPAQAPINPAAYQSDE